MSFVTANTSGTRTVCVRRKATEQSIELTNRIKNLPLVTVPCLDVVRADSKQYGLRSNEHGCHLDLNLDMRRLHRGRSGIATGCR